MLFFVKSTLFLGLVFWSIPPQNGSDAVRPDGSAVKTQIASAVRNYCNDNPSACLKMAARLAETGTDISFRTIAKSAVTSAMQSNAVNIASTTGANTLTAADRAITRPH